LGAEMNGAAGRGYQAFARTMGRESASARKPPSIRIRASFVMLGVVLAFGGVAVQLGRLAATGEPEMTASLTEPATRSFARPDIVDRQGRLLATDIEMPSLYADPSLVQGVDEVSERLVALLPELKPSDLRAQLSDRTRRFLWLRRGLPPKLAQDVHDLGLPGLEFRTELRRSYPLQQLAGHVLGSVNIDNKGATGIERTIDETVGVEAPLLRPANTGTPVRLTLDLGVQHAVEEELEAAMARYEAKGTAGLVMNVKTGAMLASVSLPGVDPARPTEALDPTRIDRIQGGTYELGSIFKILTVAMALDAGTAKLDTVLDVTKPLTAGRFTIKDLHSTGRPLTVSEVFLHSSNVGAGMLALAAGPERQIAFLDRLGLRSEARTEAGPIAPPQLPAHFGRIEQITVSYGHGIAVAPIQFAAAAASIINGGTRVTPTFLRAKADTAETGARVVSRETSRSLAVLMRRNVAEREGTGTRAEVAGYRVGGKTGTAEIPGRGGYKAKSVVSSFLAAFPMDDPQYLVLVLIFEPSGVKETDGEVLAGRNAAPTAGRVIGRIAPLLGVMPAGDVQAQLSD